MTHPALTDPEAAAAWLKGPAHIYRPHWSYERISLTRSWHNADGKPQCRHAVPEGARSVGFHQCQHAGFEQTADPERMWWCKIHGPTGQAARKAKQEARYRAEQEAREAAARRRIETNPYIRALREIAAGHNDPRALAAEVLGDLVS